MKSYLSLPFAYYSRFNSVKKRYMLFYAHACVVICSVKLYDFMFVYLSWFCQRKMKLESMNVIFSSSHSIFFSFYFSVIFRSFEFFNVWVGFVKGKMKLESMNVIFYSSFSFLYYFPFLFLLFFFLFFLSFFRTLQCLSFAKGKWNKNLWMVYSLLHFYFFLIQSFFFTSFSMSFFFFILLI